MNDQAREALRQVIRTYGATVCNTPRSCEMFIRQACGAFPEESQALIEALRIGVTNELMSYHPAEKPWDEFSGQLTRRLKRSGTNESAGNWAIDAWARALNRHPEEFKAPAPPPRPVYEELGKDAPLHGSVKTVMTLIVGLGGGLGGAAGSIMLAASILVTSAATEMPMYESMNLKANQVWLAVILILGILSSFGFVGGALGGSLGWLFGRGDRGHWKAFGTAMGGAFVSAALGNYFCGIFGSAFGGFLGAFGAATTTASRGGWD